MASDNTVIDNSAKDYAEKAAQAMNGVGPKMFQTYPTDKVDVKEMFGKFNQKNGINGMKMSNESRKVRK